jgi:hypothetical protein
MPRRKKEGKEYKELAMGGAMLVFAIGTAASAMAGASQLTIILGVFTAAVAAALALSGRKPAV